MTDIDELLKEHERLLLVKQDVDALLGRLRRVGRIELPDRVYEGLPNSCITGLDLKAMIYDAQSLVEELARASNHLYDEIRDVGEELEYRRREAKP